MLKKPLKQVSADVPITSMIDIIFLLIIFFVVTTNINQEIQDEAVRLASGPYGKPAAPDPRAVIANIHNDGSLYVAGRKVSNGEFSTLLKNIGNEYGPNFPVVIRGDREALHGDIKKVLNSIQKTGLYRIMIQALKEKE